MWTQWQKLSLLVQWVITVIIIVVTIITITIVVKLDIFDDSVLLKRAEAGMFNPTDFCYEGVTYFKVGYGMSVKLNQQGQVILCN